jgi:cell pole-organizing protein PopZ
VAAAFDDLNLAFLRAKSVPSEQGVEAMLKPMLQDWLDNNLPGIVERLVREEIARIARGDI